MDSKVIKIDREHALKAMSGKFGKENQQAARNWAIFCLMNGQEMPVKLEELAEIYGDVFITDYVKKVLESDSKVQENLWNLLIENAGVKNLCYLNATIEILIQSENNMHRNFAKLWLIKNSGDAGVLNLLFNKALTAPEILDYAEDLLKHYQTLNNAPSLISILQNLVLQYRDKLNLAMSLIERIISMSQDPDTYKTALRVLESFYTLKDNDEGQKTKIWERTYTLMANCQQAEKIAEAVEAAKLLPTAKRVQLLKVALGKEGHLSEDKIFSYLNKIVSAESLKSDRDLAEKLVDFYRMALEKKLANPVKVFIEISNKVSAYVKQNEIEIALLPWNPGISFAKYSEEMKKLTLLSLEVVVQADVFRPRSFLTALNICIFDESGKYGEKWFEEMVKKMPVNGDDRCWDDDFSPLIDHLSMLKRYPEEFQKKSGKFVVEQSKNFASLLFANYVLTSQQIDQLERLQSKLEIELGIADGRKAMEERIKNREAQSQKEESFVYEMFLDYRP